MSSRGVHSLVDRMQREVGADLRSVAVFEDGEYDVRYVREDVQEQYTADELDRIFEDLQLQALNRDHHEELYDHSDLECTVRCFSDGVELQFPLEDGGTLAVGLDRSALASGGTILSDCLQVAEENPGR